MCKFLSIFDKYSRRMFINYIKVAYRSLKRQKVYALINILGLALGLTTSLLIAFYVINELSYDRFHKNAEDIYRIYTKGKFDNNSFSGPISPAPLAEKLVKEFPEVKNVTRMVKIENRAISYEDKVTYEDNFLYADTSFFSTFTIKFLKGDASHCLSKPKSIVLTDETAKRYFGNSDPIGKLLRINNNDSVQLRVTAIVLPMPTNSHFHFDFITNLNELPYLSESNWLNNGLYTYLVLKKGSNAKVLENKLHSLVLKYVIPQILSVFGGNLKNLASSGYSITFGLQKLTDIHLYNGFDYEIEPVGNRIYVYSFIAIAIFILLMACINFLNLATARSSGRAKEVGLRKALGSNRRQLVFQFIIESVMLSLSAIILSLLFIELILPAFNGILNTNISITPLFLYKYVPFIFLFALVIGIIAGLYPAIYLSSFQPATVLKGKIRSGVPGITQRDLLVIFQFTVSIVIILCTFTVYKQIRYIQHKKLGYDKESIIVIQRTDPIKREVKTFMDKLMTNPVIVGTALSNAVPGLTFSAMSFQIEGSPPYQSKLFEFLLTSDNYAKIMGLTMVEGRYFSPENKNDANAVVLNETAAKMTGLKNIIGKHIIAPGFTIKDKRDLTIIGVVKNFHYASLHKPINSLLIALNNSYYDGYITVKVQRGKNREALAFIHDTWKKQAKNFPLEYFFFDQQFDKLYISELQTQRILEIFTLLAITLACLGLFGLVSYTTENRTKEIGIRKIMGASVLEIVSLISLNTVKLILLSAIIAVPIAYTLINKWLQDFAFKVTIHWWVYILIPILMLLIALITISYQSIKAATSNPVESLRYE
jgi:putative ABC transport system permease protein